LFLVSRVVALCCLTDPSPPPPHTLSLHDALPISRAPAPSGGEPCAHDRLHRLERRIERLGLTATGLRKIRPTAAATAHLGSHRTDRKSTRLNSSHGSISYAVFCLKKKKQK